MPEVGKPVSEVFFDMEWEGPVFENGQQTSKVERKYQCSVRGSYEKLC